MDPEKGLEYYKREIEYLKSKKQYFRAGITCYKGLLIYYEEYEFDVRKLDVKYEDPRISSTKKEQYICEAKLKHCEGRQRYFNNEINKIIKEYM